MPRAASTRRVKKKTKNKIDQGGMGGGGGEKKKTQHCAQADTGKFNRNNSNIYSKPMARTNPIPWDA